jgi:hypothetical protein
MTQQTTLGSICQLTGESCRFLSMEWTVKLYTKLKKDVHTGLYIPGAMGSRKALLGPYCNNHQIKKSGWVVDMVKCPIQEGMDAPAVKIPARLKKR